MAFIENRKVHMNFEVRETLEAGIELRGFESKAVYKNLGSLDGAKVIIRGGEAYIVGLYIPPYQAANTPTSYDQYRVRRLLLNKKEIMYMATAGEGTGLTLIPISLYYNRTIKVEVGICKAKNKGDKRQALREKDDKKNMRVLQYGE
jgi:SsrA-binding protein